MELRNKPVPPPASAKYIFGRYLHHHREWLTFIEGW
jgi:hypothetical protein